MSTVKVMPTPSGPLDSIQKQLEERAGVLLRELEQYQAIEDELRKVTRAIKVLKGESLGQPRISTGKPKGRPSKLVKNQGKPGVSRSAIEMILRAHPRGLTLTQIQTELAEKAKIKLTTAGIYGSLRGRVKASKQAGTVAKVYQLK